MAGAPGMLGVDRAGGAASTAGAASTGAGGATDSDATSSALGLTAAPAAPAAGVPATVPLAALDAPRGALRLLDSVPYQNSVSLPMARLRTDDAWRDGEHDLRLVVRFALRTEQAADDGNVAEARDVARAVGFTILDEAGKNLRLAVLQTQQSSGIARADLVRNAFPPSGPHFLGDELTSRWIEIATSPSR